MPSARRQIENYNQSTDALRVHLLGTVDFDSAMFLQERLVYETSGSNDCSGTLLICEHPPMITIGREGSFGQLRAAPDELKLLGLETRWVNRGGSAVVHSPGQLSLYPIVPLDRLGMGLHDFRRAIENSVISACQDLKIATEQRPDQPGVWTRCGQIGHLGVSVRSSVSYHGMFVNVAPNLDLQQLVKPLGVKNRVSSLSATSGRPAAMHRIREGLIRGIVSNLGYEHFHLFTGHPLLKRTRRKVYVNA